MGALKRVIGAGLVVVLFTFSLFLVRSQSSSSPDFDTVESVQELPEVTIEIPQGCLLYTSEAADDGRDV
jgi:hypothetical protein